MQEPLGSLRVEVVDADGRVVPSAVVWIHRSERCTTDPYRRNWGKTEGNGVAVFKSLAAGEWHVVAESSVNHKQAHVETAVKAGEEPRVLVRLESGLVIAGRVLSRTGFESISVTAVSDIGCGYRGTVVNHEDGTFRMEGLCPGPWRCHADILGSDVGLEPWGGSGEDVLASIGSVPMAASAPVLVTESREDLELVLPKAGNLSGRFIGLGDGHRRGVAINRDTQHRYALRFDHEEFAAIGLDPGTYMIAGTNMEGWGVLDGVKVEEEGDLKDLEIRIEPAARLSILRPSEQGRTSIFFHGLALPAVLADGSAETYLVPAGQLEVEMRLAGSRQVKAVDAIGGQALTLTF